MSAIDEEKNNPPLWLIVVGIIIVSIAAIFVMLAPTKQYTQKNQFYLHEAQGSVIYKTDKNQNNFDYKSLDKVLIG
ncbi:MAG: hypothetical protein M1480_14775 [Bacteroidetes bacterium]|nr:hypothetical protein [Bacteroidota bacterium]